MLRDYIPSLCTTHPANVFLTYGSRIPDDTLFSLALRSHLRFCRRPFFRAITVSRLTASAPHLTCAIRNFPVGETAKKIIENCRTLLTYSLLRCIVEYLVIKWFLYLLAPRLLIRISTDVSANRETTISRVYYRLRLCGASTFCVSLRHSLCNSMKSSTGSCTRIAYSAGLEII